MKKRILRICKTMGAVLVVLVLFAMPVLAQTYTAEIDLQETAGTSYTMLPVLMPLDTTGLIADFYLSATGLDSRVTDGATYPHMLADDKLLFGFPLAGNSSNPLEFSAGNAALGAYDILVGQDGYITVIDIAALEPGPVFEFEIDGYVNTAAGANKNLVDKDDALETYISGASEITSVIYYTPINQAAQTNDYHLSSDAAHYQRVGQRLDVFPDSVVYRVGFYLKKFGNPAGNASVTVRRVSDDGIVGTVGTIDVTTIGAGFAWFEVYASEVTNPTTQDVRIAIEYNGGDAANYIECAYAGPVIPGVLTVYQLAAWTDVPGGDCTIRVYYKQPVVAAGVPSDEYIVVTEAGTLLWDTGDVLEFDGTIAGLINAGAIHNASAKLWVSMWFRRDVAATNYLWGKAIVLGVDHLIAYMDVAGSINFYKYVGGVQVFTINTAPTTYPDGDWHHAIFSISNVNGVRLRIDNGAAITDVDISAAPNGGDFVIGHRDDPGLGAGTTGLFANVIVGTDDLTPAEETALYQGTAPGDENNLWSIGEGAGTRIIDYGSDDNEGTAGAGCTWGSAIRPCWFGISIDGVVADAFDTYISVPDNANNWIINQNNVLPYMTSYKQSVGGILISHYEPITYITGTTLPDRQGVAQNGIITWGTNPTGVSAIMGSLVPTGSYAAEDDPLETPDAAGEIAGVVGVISDDAAMESAWDLLFPFIGDTATTTNTPQVLLVWFLSGAVVIGLIVVAHRYMQNMWLTGIAGLMGVGIGIAMGAFPGWFLIVAVLSVIGIVTLERSPSL